MTIKKGVSITLCTYNGKKLLEQTLKHITAQQFDVPCELILVDNASTDGTKDFADQWWQNHGNDAITYTSLEQPIPGKSYAQDLAYQKASYEYILVCDDDNWLNDTYIQLSYELMEQHPYIGALGGCSEAVFEEDPPHWFQQYERYYAVGKQARSNGDITTTVGYLYGAGMVIRKSHWLKLKALGFEHLLSCRKGDSLSSGGDTEYCYALQLLGYNIWYHDQLKFKHFMTTGRLNFTYLSRLRKAMVYSNFVIMSYRDVLLNVESSRGLFFNRIVSLLNHGFIKNCYRFLLGSYEQKEVAKTYFGKLYYLMFHRREYIANVNFIKRWLDKSGSVTSI